MNRNFSSLLKAVSAFGFVLVTIWPSLFFSCAVGQQIKFANETDLRKIAANLSTRSLENSSLLSVLSNVTEILKAPSGAPSGANFSFPDIQAIFANKTQVIFLNIILPGPNISYHPMINLNFGGSYFNDNNSSISLGYGPTYGPTTGVMFGPTIGSTFGPSYGASIGNTFGPMYGPSIGPTFGSSFGPTIGATYGPSYGATYGETYGPSYGATYGGTYGPSYGATYGPTIGPSYGATYGSTYGPSYGATYGNTIGPGYGAVYNVQALPNGPPSGFSSQLMGLQTPTVSVQSALSPNQTTPLLHKDGSTQPSGIEALLASVRKQGFLSQRSFK